jgi:magnesium transporter
LQPRDLRRIDPSLSVGKSIYSIAVRDGCMLMALGGVRLIVAGDCALLFEPNSDRAKQFLDIAIAQLQHRNGSPGATLTDNRLSWRSMGESSDDDGGANPSEGPPFELEVVEAALIVATGALDVELANIEARVRKVLSKLPRQIIPVNLEELRRVKASLVDIESKADALREILEDLMDDEDELREMNLSSRPRREERRRQRERERLEREREYERE